MDSWVCQTISDGLPSSNLLTPVLMDPAITGISLQRQILGLNLVFDLKIAL